MAERQVNNSIFAADKSFNPHHTGEWLKDTFFDTMKENGEKFQSSSYWRMAES